MSNQESEFLNWKDNVAIPRKQDGSNKLRTPAHTLLVFDETDGNMAEIIRAVVIATKTRPSQGCLVSVEFPGSE